MSARPQPARRSDFRHVSRIAIRLADVDVYGHVNNAVYGQYFDTAINIMLIGHAIVGPRHIGLVVNSTVDFLAPLTFPGDVDVGVAVAAIGRTSVSYAYAAFPAGGDQPAAQGRYRHVFVDPAHRRPIPLDDELRARLTALMATPAD